MNAMNVTKARTNLFKIMSFVNDNSQPLTLTNSNGKKCSTCRTKWLKCHSGNSIFEFSSRHDRIINKRKKYPFSRLSFRRWSRVVKMYLIKYDKQSTKDINNLKSAKLDVKAKSLIEILWKKSSGTALRRTCRKFIRFIFKKNKYSA